ncbi:MAG: hypothetical protein WC732_06990 [Candidatus Omnitrophota bacterium]
MDENRHDIMVKTSDRSALVEQIVLWGEASWWPRKSLMSFERLTGGAIAPGTKYIQKVVLPRGPRWRAEVSELTASGISRVFSDGMFSGYERVNCEPVGEGFRVDYVMHYEIAGALNKLLWALVFRRLHDQNIEEILRQLKRYMEKA